MKKLKSETSKPEDEKSLIFTSEGNQSDEDSDKEEESSSSSGTSRFSGTNVMTFKEFPKPVSTYVTTQVNEGIRLARALKNNPHLEYTGYIPWNLSEIVKNPSIDRYGVLSFATRKIMSPSLQVKLPQFQLAFISQPQLFAHEIFVEKVYNLMNESFSPDNHERCP